MGTDDPQANGYQYTFADNVVKCIMEDQEHIWGIEINNSSYGLIQGNVVHNWNGAGISLVSGTEVHNMIQGNFVTRTDGTGVRTTTGLDGMGYWSFDPDNAFVNNVATDINQGGAYSYGFNINASFLGTVKVPAYQGADPALAGQSTSVNMNGTPLLQFSGNEVYGATPNGLSLWWIGALLQDRGGPCGHGRGFPDLEPVPVGLLRIRDQPAHDRRVRGPWGSPRHRGSLQGILVRRLYATGFSDHQRQCPRRGDRNRDARGVERTHHDQQ